MWLTKRIDLARGLLVALPAVAIDDPPDPAPDDAELPPDRAPGALAEAFVTLRLTLSRAELASLAGALMAALDETETRIDSPARLAAALDLVIRRIGGRGRAHVVRHPAGLSTPEAWEVRIEAADGTTRSALADLGRGRRPGLAAGAGARS